jgi:hypothetical protein
MEKPIAADRVLANVLDYTMAARYIDTVLGFEQRHAHKRFKKAETIEGPDGKGQQRAGEYLDYWHFVMNELFDAFQNDTYVRYGPYNFVDFAKRVEEEFGEKNWRSHIAKVWAQEYPDKYEIWMSW